MSTKREGVPTYDKAELDEPIFVLRAQDIVAPVMVELYALHLAGRAANRDRVEQVRKVACEMRAWQALHGCKMSD